MVVFFSSFVELFWSGISSFDVPFSLVHNKLIEKQQQTSKQTTNIKVKINAKTRTKVENKCEKKNKDGLPPNKG